MFRSTPPAIGGRRRTSIVQGEAGDRELMRRVVADDAGAFGAFYDRHASSVYGLAYRILRERSAAEDVAQEAFIALWRSRSSYRPERGTPGAWLLTITRNRAIDAIRRGRAHLCVEFDTDRDHEAPERTDEQALRRVEAVTIGVALRTLPDAQRQVLELSYFGGLSHSEIAARVGLPLGTIKGQMRLALKKLAAQLDAPHGFQTEPARSSLDHGRIAEVGSSSPSESSSKTPRDPLAVIATSTRAKRGQTSPSSGRLGLVREE